ncbi:MAG: hypothetical protein OXU62_04280 [Gammaproteobacteria bacterium]|nr:hypothetical protein [Gammaproteobacteria bacterium]
MKSTEILHAAWDLEKTGFSHAQTEAVTRVVSKLAETMATKDDIARLDAELANMATKDELARLEANMATKDELARLEESTKAEFARLEANVATKAGLAKLETTMKSEIARLDSDIAVLRSEVGDLRRTLHSVVVPLMILNTAMIMAMAGIMLTSFNFGVSP